MKLTAVWNRACCRLSTKTIRIMRMMIILLTVTFLHASAGTVAQTVTLSVKNAPLEEVFKEIKKQSGYAFFFD